MKPRPSITPDDVLAIAALYELRVARLVARVWRWRIIALVCAGVAWLR